MEIEENTLESCAFIKGKVSDFPKIAVVLGSGLGGLSAEVAVHQEISYRDIPHFPVSTVAGHSGNMVIGTLNRVPVCILNGRKHFYEGVPMREVVFPVKVLHSLGVETLILSNAAGALNPSFQVGDVMLIEDHISLFPANPFEGMPDVAEKAVSHPIDIYSKELIKKTLQVAKKLDIPLQHGVYTAHSGPYYGTLAESTMQFQMGADAVGMSTIPEAQMAKMLGMNVLAFSVLTDLAIIGSHDHPTHEAVLKAATAAGEKLVCLVGELLPEL